MLDLSTEQHTAIRALFAEMEKRARELDRQFAEATIAEEELSRLVSAIAETRESCAWYICAPTCSCAPS